MDAGKFHGRDLTPSRHLHLQRGRPTRWIY
jgi:hypothetical protein